MEEIRCIRCGRPLRDPTSIARGTGPECAGSNGSHRKRQRTRIRALGRSYYSAIGHGSTLTPTLFSLVEVGLYSGKGQPFLEAVIPPRNELPETLTKYPADLVDLVLSPPAPGAIASHIKSYSKKKKPMGSVSPAPALQEIRRMCIDLRLTFFPGMFDHQGQPIACVPHGVNGWKFDNSEKVISRPELESYLARYGMIRLAVR